MEQNDTKYNGWTNYETWRVGLECFDGWSIACTFSADEWTETMKDQWDDMVSLPHSWTNFETAEMFKQYMISFMVGYMKELPEMWVDDVEDTTLNGWLHAFLDRVNWREIAEHHLEDDEMFNDALQTIKQTGEFA